MHHNCSKLLQRRSDIAPTLLQTCFTTVPKLLQTSSTIDSNLCQKCPKIAPKLFSNCFNINFKLLHHCEAIASKCSESLFRNCSNIARACDTSPGPYRSLALLLTSSRRAVFGPSHVYESTQQLAAPPGPGAYAAARSVNHPWRRV